MILIAALVIWLTLVLLAIVLARGAASADRGDIARSEQRPSGFTASSTAEAHAGDADGQVAEGLVLVDRRRTPARAG
jgi:hypothetical protein